MDANAEGGLALVLALKEMLDDGGAYAAQLAKLQELSQRNENAAREILRARNLDVEARDLAKEAARLDAAAADLEERSGRILQEAGVKAAQELAKAHTDAQQVLDGARLREENTRRLEVFAEEERARLANLEKTLETERRSIAGEKAAATRFKNEAEAERDRAVALREELEAKLAKAKAVLEAA